MRGNSPMFDLSRKTLFSMTPVRLGPHLMGILVARLHQPEWDARGMLCWFQPWVLWTGT